MSTMKKTSAIIFGPRLGPVCWGRPIGNLFFAERHFPLAAIFGIFSLAVVDNFAAVCDYPFA